MQRKRSKKLKCRAIRRQVIYHNGTGLRHGAKGSGGLMMGGLCCGRSSPKKREGIEKKQRWLCCSVQKGGRIYLKVAWGEWGGGGVGGYDNAGRGLSLCGPFPRGGECKGVRVGRRQNILW